ncbi:hypothetical protein ACFO1B_16400 [Dactylosporangium siamense]|nr:hypothetical protein [Dactylosporangium siamense]
MPPPNEVVVFFLAVFLAAGVFNLVEARRWFARRRQGIPPPRQTFWNASHSVPRHPVDGYLYGALFLALAAACVVVLVGRRLHRW